jgi:hypothetical protein
LSARFAAKANRGRVGLTRNPARRLMRAVPCQTRRATPG